MNLISQSKEMSHEYCATVVRIGEVKPIVDTNNLATVMVEGREIVVRKDRVKEGDVMIYVSNECQLDQDFLHYNNEFQDEELNANYPAVRAHIEEMQKNGATPDEIKEYVAAHRGYFDKKCRVRMKRLRGVLSMGYLITPEQMSTYNENFAIQKFNWSEHVGEDFDTVYNSTLFVKAYVPELPEVRAKKGRAEKAIKRFNRMIPGQFAFHYDTQQLQRNMDRLRPNTSVAISVKEHGTSAIFGNVKVKQPRWDGLYARLFNYLPNWLRFTKEGYDLVYSSRTVIKNATLNPEVSGGFYDTDVWAEYREILNGIIPKGMTIYGEIVGYITKSTKGIQSLGGKVYDYGCKPGENKLMIYRIKSDENGVAQEWDVDMVYVFTKGIIEVLKMNDEKNGTHYAGRIVPIDILFNGKLRDLYHDLCESKEFGELLEPRKAVEGEDKYTRDARIKHNNVLQAELDYMNEWMSQHQGHYIEDFISDVVSHDSLIYKAWQEVMLNRLKSDANFMMEKNEPMCVNKLPREGIVLRINNDPMAEAFKLKTEKFLFKESCDIDDGKVDMEMDQRY